MPLPRTPRDLSLLLLVIVMSVATMWEPQGVPLPSAVLVFPLIWMIHRGWSLAHPYSGAVVAGVALLSPFIGHMDSEDALIALSYLTAVALAVPRAKRQAKPSSTPLLLPARAESPPKRPSKRTVLFIGSQQSFLPLTSILRHSGHRAFVEKDAEASLARAADIAPDILCIDAELPHEAARRIATAAREKLALRPLIVAVRAHTSPHAPLDAWSDFELIEPIGVPDIEFILSKNPGV